MRTLPLAVVAAVTTALVTGCMSVPEPDTASPRHHPAGQSTPLPLHRPAHHARSAPVGAPRGLEELAWIGPSDTADRKARKRPAARPDRPRKSVSTPWRARPSYPRKRTPAARPRSAKRWVPTMPRVPTGGGMKSVCRSAQGITSSGLVSMCAASQAAERTLSGQPRG